VVAKEDAMSKWIVVAVVLWVFTPMLALAQQAVKCEDQLRLSNNLVNQFAGDRNRVQVELGQTIIALENAQKELDELKKKAAPTPKK